MADRAWNIAVVGAGPAGIFAAEALQRSSLPTRIDVYERQPVPYGLVRYGLAPDHPLTQSLSEPLRVVLDQRAIRLIAGVDIGVDVSLTDLRKRYDAVVVATGAAGDVPSPVAGSALPGSFGASEFVAWYNSHPDSRRSWDLTHAVVAVVGAGNVALDVTRMLIKSNDDLDQTDISERVRTNLRASRVTDVHLFARRGPAEAAFSVAELRELDQIPDVQILVDPADMVFDRSSGHLMAASKQRRMIGDTLRAWSERWQTPSDATKRIHLHFMQAPSRVTGDGHVEGLTVERTRHRVNGTVEGIGSYRHYDVGQVYRAIGYASVPLAGAPFDGTSRLIPNLRGRVIDEDRSPVDGLYVAGWIKRGPVGLIGMTRMDAQTTAEAVVADLSGRKPAESSVDPLLALTEEFNLDPVDWDGWLRVERREQQDGARLNRPRSRVDGRAALLRVARGQSITDTDVARDADEEPR